VGDRFGGTGSARHPVVGRRAPARLAYFVPEERARGTMANRWVGAAAGLIGGQVVGRVLSVFLSSRTGERLLTKVDGSVLTPLEHRVLAQRWAGNIGKTISAAVAALFVVGGASEPGQGIMSQLAAVRHHTMGGPAQRKIDWVQVMQRVAEVMLAVGAIFKVVGEYLEDRQKTATETERAAAKRLT
jgi:hypothetical protein